MASMASTVPAWCIRRAFVVVTSTGVVMVRLRLG